MRLGVYFILWVFCLLSTPAYAQMKLHLYDLPDRLTPQENKGYNFFLNDLLQGYPYSVEKKYAPLRRNGTSFIRGEGNCIFPSNVNALAAGYPEVQGMDLLASKAIDVVSVYVYVPRGSDIPKSLSDLYNKNIGYIIGNAAANFIKDEPINLHTARNNETLMTMLERGRIEGIMGFHPDMPIAFDELGYTQLVYSSELTLLKAPIVFVCHASPLTENFIHHVDKMIPIMARDGRTQRYLGKHAEIVPYPLDEVEQEE